MAGWRRPRGWRSPIHHDGLAVRSDRTLLGRIVGNLIENAIQYTATGAVRVECRRAGDGRVRIDVQDTGIGIPPEQMEDIWSEFHQVGNPERDRNKGLGPGSCHRPALGQTAWLPGRGIVGAGPRL